jgi:hypothetical protein
LRGVGEQRIREVVKADAGGDGGGLAEEFAALQKKDPPTSCMI